jgi:Acetyltransferase (GNAT) family
MVSIIFDDLPGYPWLAGLFVLPWHRGKETGSRLVLEAEKLLANNGVATAYLFTESARSFLEKPGWHAIRRAACNGYPLSILKKTILGYLIRSFSIAWKTGAHRHKFAHLEMDKCGVLGFFTRKRACAARASSVEPHAMVEVYSSMFLREEEYRRLQRRTDRLCSLIVSSGASQREIQSERQELRAQALRLFPDRMDLYDMIYESRFDRLWQQFRPG